METDCSNFYEELNNMQLKIAVLFKDLMIEKNNYKQNLENVIVNLKQLSTEAENVRKENEELRKINDEMKNIICKSVRVFRSVNLSALNLKAKQKIELENLKKILFDTDKKLESIKLMERNDLEMEPTGKFNDITSNRVSEEEIQREFESIKNLKFTTQFFCEDEPDSSCKEECALKGKNSELVLLEKKTETLDEKSKILIDDLLEPKAEDFDWKDKNPSSCDLEQHSFEKSPLTNSPVFRDFGVHRQDNVLTDGSDNTSKSSPLNSAKENMAEKSRNFLISPWKKSNDLNKSSPSKGPTTPKRARKKLKITSPKISLNLQLKKSNSREAEISISGVRKLTQTLLNVKCYKKKNSEDWKSAENQINENVENSNESEQKNFVDAEDDFIIESPKKTDHLLEDMKKKIKNEDVLNKIQFITPPDTSDADLDETYISASIVRKCNLTKKHSLEKIIEDQTPLKRPAREKSIEYDESVPFVYKRDPVRKKSERIKLPGHACLECNRYYENAFGDIDTQDFKKILNKCSRHRDKISPTQEETPPGFWKPYLTCSIKISPKKTGL